MDRHADSVVAEAGEQLGWHQCSCPKGSAHCRRRGPGEGTSFGVLSRSGLRRLRGADGRAAIAVIARDPGQFVVIIAELHLPPPIGFEVLNADCDANPSVYVVMITGCASIDSPVRAAWRGLAHYRGGSADESLNDPFLLRTCGRLSVQRCRLADLIARTGSVGSRQSREVVRGHLCCSRCCSQFKTWLGDR